MRNSGIGAAERIGDAVTFTGTRGMAQGSRSSMGHPRLAPEMSAATGLAITQIHNARQGAKDTNEEWVLIFNQGTHTLDIRDWLLTDETDQQLRPHVYKFPATLAEGQGWSFAPGEAIYVFTGRGADLFVPRPFTGSPQFHLYWNRNAMVWNNSGDRVYLRNGDGTFVTQPFPVP